MHDFYLICPIGTEDTLIKELKIKDLNKSILKLNKEKGGLLITCELNFGLSLNKVLKTCTRILLRLKEQKCRDFPKLYKIISKFDFKPYIVQEEVEFIIHTHKSRIINTKKALETCQDAFEKYINAHKLKDSILGKYQNVEKQKFYIRIENDNLTLSIDCSGNSPYKRSEHKIKGHASMRETYASLLITETLALNYDFKTIVDPMCGSGTILKEFRDYYHPNNRNYIYERWPLARDKEEIPLVKGPDFKLIGHDRDQSVLKNTKDIVFENEDLFEGGYKDLEKVIVISNPPYGKRVKISEDRVNFYNKMVHRIKEKFKPRVIGFVAPSEVPLTFNKILSFNNNGIKVNFYLIF
jgi:putative N6-adenine-specific DNA methylase